MKFAGVHTCSNLHLMVQAIQSWSRPGNDGDTALDKTTIQPLMNKVKHTIGLSQLLLSMSVRLVVSSLDLLKVGKGELCLTLIAHKVV